MRHGVSLWCHWRTTARAEIVSGRVQNGTTVVAENAFFVSVLCAICLIGGSSSYEMTENYGTRRYHRESTGKAGGATAALGLRNEGCGTRAACKGLSHNVKRRGGGATASTGFCQWERGKGPVTIEGPWCEDGFCLPNLLPVIVGRDTLWR